MILSEYIFLINMRIGYPYLNHLVLILNYVYKLLMLKITSLFSSLNHLFYQQV